METIAYFRHFHITLIHKRYLTLVFHGKWSQLFKPVSFERTHFSDMHLLVQDAYAIINGRYANVRLLALKNQMESVPEAVAL
jgi:hypothetical protein